MFIAATLIPDPSTVRQVLAVDHIYAFDKTIEVPQFCEARSIWLLLKVEV